MFHGKHFYTMKNTRLLTGVSRETLCTLQLHRSRHPDSEDQIFPLLPFFHPGLQAAFLHEPHRSIHRVAEQSGIPDQSLPPGTRFFCQQPLYLGLGLGHRHLSLTHMVGGLQPQAVLLQL